jgi:hypothetical protein
MYLVGAAPGGAPEENTGTSSIWVSFCGWGVCGTVSLAWGFKLCNVLVAAVFLIFEL